VEATYDFPPPVGFGTALAENYARIHSSFEPYRPILNSLLVAIPKTAGLVLVSALAGYGFARYRRVHGHRPFLMVAFATMFFPPSLGLIPLFIEMRWFGWLDTFWPLIVPAMASSFGVIWMYTYIQASVPDELYEAAEIDGAGGLRTFVLFFRWRTLPYGAEYFWHGLLDYGSQSHRRLQEVERFEAEVLNLADHVLASRCVAHAGMVYDYDNESDAKVATVFTEARAVGDRSIYQVLSERHMLADLVPSQRLSDLQDIGRYPLHFHTNAQMMERAEVEPLRAYVEQGGTLVLGPRSGYRDRRSFCYMEPFPGVLRALVGAEIVDFTTIAQGEAPTMTLDGGGGTVSAPGFNEILRPESADVQVLARYASGYYAGEAAIVARQVGRGRVVYCGAFFAPDNIAALLDVLGFDDPHSDWADIPRDVEVVTRENTEGRFHIIMNFSGEPQPLHFVQDMVNLQSGARMNGPHVLEPYDVLVAVKPAKVAGSDQRRLDGASARALEVGPAAGS
jgi:hypothetical protein